MYQALKKAPATLLLAGLSVCTFFGVLQNDFVRWDDDLLVYENVHVQEFSIENVVWAFTHFDPELYIPLTFLTFQVDWLIGGGDVFPFHLGNLILHTLNVLLVFAVSSRLLKNGKIAFFTACLFAVHPIQTEAVAWVSARKDVLSGFFFLLSLYFYLVSSEDSRGDFAGRLHAARIRFASIAAFLLGMLAKVSIILLPLVLLLVDRWQEKRVDKSNLISKAPYFAISLTLGLIAVLGKQKALDSSTVFDKLLMACKSTVWYLQHLLIPERLSVLYPYRGQISMESLDFQIPLVVIGFLAILIFALRKHWKTLTVGSGFFLIMLLPSFTNFAKAGELYVASDRYVYLASIGFYWIVAAVFTKMYDRIFPALRFVVISMFLMILLSFSVLSYNQVPHWNNTETLFERVLTLYPDSHIAHNNIGVAIASPKRMEEMETRFRRAIELKPGYADAHNNLGVVLMQQGKRGQAIAAFGNAVEANPNHKKAKQNLQDALQQR